MRDDVATNPQWPPHVAVVLGALGAIGMVLIVAAGVIAGPHGPTGSAVERDVTALAPSGAAGVACASVALVLGIAAVLTAWILLGLVLRRGAPLRPLFGIAAVWSVPLVFGPPLFSRDVYSYAADGLMVNRHLNPNRHGPVALGSSHFVAPVGEAWRNTRSPYGPLFLRISGWTVQIAHNNVFTSVVLLRLVAVFGVALIAVSLPALAVSVGKDPARALWLGVCNPLVLVHFIGGAHNDALMIGLVAAGLALAAGHPRAGMLLCVAGASMKAPAAIAAAFIVAETVRKLPREQRLLAFVRLTAIAVAAFAAITWATGLGWAWIGALGVPGMNRSPLTPTTFIAQTTSAVIGHDAAVLSATRALAIACTLAGVAYLIWRAPKIGTVRACGLAFALTVALGPVVLPWYVLWGIVVLAAAGRRIERGYAIFASAVLLIAVQPSGSAMPDVVLILTVLALSGAALAIGWSPVRSWIRQDLAVAIDEYRAIGRVRSVARLARRALRESGIARAAPSASRPS